MVEVVNQIPLKLVGGNTFGRYPKIDLAQTFNMIISGNALVPYAGYNAVATIALPVPNSNGRGLYTSVRAGMMFAVVGGSLYSIDTSLNITPLGTLETASGNVWMSENNNNEICISDGVTLYVYNYTGEGAFSIANKTAGFTIDFTPGYLSFQDGRLLTAALNIPGPGTSWRLSDFNDALSWPDDSMHVGVLQTKPDVVQAAVPFPGAGNILFLFGQTVVEQWTDVGATLFPYQRSSNFNVDYGCLSAATIAHLETFIVWLGGNEQSGPIIMYSTGGNAQKISTEGIDFKFSTLVDPTDSYAFLFKQDGHLIYQITFLTDNLTYIYDFETQMFFTATNENLDHHIARKVVFFNNKYYFVSFTDGNLYEFGTQYTTFQYSSTQIEEIPRIRICPPVRLQTERNFIVKTVVFTLEQGQANEIDTIEYTVLQDAVGISTENGFVLVTEDGLNVITTEMLAPEDNREYQVVNMAVDLSISRDGGQSFGGNYRQNLNPTGKRRNRMVFYRLGQMNDATFQFRFSGFSRFVCLEGLVEVSAVGPISDTYQGATQQ